MADEHTRKYDDWQIEKPAEVRRSRPLTQAPENRSHISPTSTPTKEADKADHTRPNNEQGSEDIGNPFDSSAPAQNSEQTSGAETATAAAPFAATQDVPHQTQAESLDSNIDAETGLPIPDYIKPYTKQDPSTDGLNN